MYHCSAASKMWAKRPALSKEELARFVDDIYRFYNDTFIYLFNDENRGHPWKIALCELRFSNRFLDLIYFRSIFCFKLMEKATRTELFGD